MGVNNKNKSSQTSDASYWRLMSDGTSMEVLPAKKIVEIIETKFDAMAEQIDSLQEENRELKDAAYASKELADMKSRLKEMEEYCYRGFPISKEESDRIAEWQKQHAEKVHSAMDLESKIRFEGVSGGRWIYEFLPTAIGTSGTCICGACRSQAYREAGDPNSYKSHGDYMDALSKALKKYDAEFEFQHLG